ncbi:MAG: pseudouridine synthase [Mariprofundaceae bacterium]|nr:pseudouridine synthase [Mariprofundaceae bacterium]
MKYTCETQNTALVVDALAEKSTLSKGQIKDAMNKGAVWIQKGKKQRRLRRAKATFKKGEKLHLYHDPQLLSCKVEAPILLEDLGTYSVWQKPAGLLSQGTKYGDHYSLLRQVELAFQPARKVFLIHRLDREASGLMLIAHQPHIAAQLSAYFQDNSIEKRYRIQVRGQAPKQGCFDDLLDDKTAKTSFTYMQYDQEENVSMVDVLLHGGRHHQIRRHFDMHDLPVMGDPRYGKNNKNTVGLALCAYHLAFVCPQSQQKRVFCMPTPF